MLGVLRLRPKSVPLEKVQAIPMIRKILYYTFIKKLKKGKPLNNKTYFKALKILF